METWHDRLQIALTAKGKDWPDLVTVTGLKKPSVYAWKPTATKRSTMMDGANVAKVCKFLGINPMWLFHNEGPSGLEDAVISDEALAIAKAYQRLPQEVRLDIQRDIKRAELAEKWKAQQSEALKSNRRG